MTTLITDIVTPNWQLSPDSFGAVVTDADDILLCIHNIIFTRKMEVPFDLDFGSRVFDFSDRPIQQTAPAIIAELYDAIGTYEKRVRIDAIRLAEDTEIGGYSFVIAMTIVASASALEYKLDYINKDKTGGKAWSYGFSDKFS